MRETDLTQERINFSTLDVTAPDSSVHVWYQCILFFQQNSKKIHAISYRGAMQENIIQIYRGEILRNLFAEECDLKSGDVAL